ncbi:MAG: hypothetical protein AAF202_06350 [Pseudomonadota bacterium]
MSLQEGWEKLGVREEERDLDMPLWMKKQTTLGALSLAGLLLVGCGGNPDNKESTPIDRTRMFQKTVRGEYASNNGEILHFGDRKRLLISSSHDYRVSLDYRTGQITLKIREESGYERTEYLSITLDTPIEESLFSTVSCQFDHAATIESVEWLPRPKDEDKISHEIERFRDQSDDINYVIYIDTIKTINTNLEMGSFENQEVDDKLSESTSLTTFLEEFCADDSRPRYSDEDNEWRTTYLPLHSFNKNGLKVIQYRQGTNSSLMKLGVSTSMSEGSTQVEFSKVTE